MASISPLKLFGLRREGDYKAKVLLAIKNIEFHRKELDTLKGRLSERRQLLFDMTVRALQEKDKPKAGIYAGEHTELMKVIKVVTTSELALTQMMLRMQSMTEIGDAMAHMNSAFKTMREVGKTMQEFAPALGLIQQLLIESRAKHARRNRIDANSMLRPFDGQRFCK